MRFKEFQKEVAGKTFDDLYKMIRDSNVFPIYKKAVMETDSKTDKLLGSLVLMSAVKNEERSATLNFVANNVLFKKLDKRFRREIIGEEPKKKDKVKKEDVRKMIIECFYHYYETGTELRNDILKKLEEM